MSAPDWCTAAHWHRSYGQDQCSERRIGPQGGAGQPHPRLVRLVLTGATPGIDLQDVLISVSFFCPPLYPAWLMQKWLSSEKTMFLHCLQVQFWRCCTQRSLCCWYLAVRIRCTAGDSNAGFIAVVSDAQLPRNGPTMAPKGHPGCFSGGTEVILMVLEQNMGIFYADITQGLPVWGLSRVLPFAWKRLHRWVIVERATIRLLATLVWLSSAYRHPMAFSRSSA